MKNSHNNLKILGFLCVAIGLCLAPHEVESAVKLSSICTIYGQQETQLASLGLVVGLEGTGDSSKFQPAIQALRRALGFLNDRDPEKKDLFETGLKETKNVALVIVSATIPAEGIRKGKKIDCYVSSVGSAKSLRGGRLLATPLSDSKNINVFGIAAGGIRIEEGAKVNGKIPLGVSITENFLKQYIQQLPDGTMTFKLVLNPDHASFVTASEVARIVSSETRSERIGNDAKDLVNEQEAAARPLDAVEILVTIPSSYESSPVDFISNVLETRIENPNTEARVVINLTTKTIGITGDVEIDPVIVSHKNLKVFVGEGANLPGAEDESASFGFRAVVDPDRIRDSQNTAQQDLKLQGLLDALNQLKVSPKDQIDIVRTLQKTGRLHAKVKIVD